MRLGGHAPNFVYRSATKQMWMAAFAGHIIGLGELALVALKVRSSFVFMAGFTHNSVSPSFFGHMECAEE